MVNRDGLERVKRNKDHKRGGQRSNTRKERENEIEKSDIRCILTRLNLLFSDVLSSSNEVIALMARKNLRIRTL